jgi:hypothetical protein
LFRALRFPTRAAGSLPSHLYLIYRRSAVSASWTVTPLTPPPLPPLDCTASVGGISCQHCLRAAIRLGQASPVRPRVRHRWADGVPARPAPIGPRARGLRSTPAGGQPRASQGGHGHEPHGRHAVRGGQPCDTWCVACVDGWVGGRGAWARIGWWRFAACACWAHQRGIVGLLRACAVFLHQPPPPQSLCWG